MRSMCTTSALLSLAHLAACGTAAGSSADGSVLVSDDDADAIYRVTR